MQHESDSFILLNDYTDESKKILIKKIRYGHLVSHLLHKEKNTYVPLTIGMVEPILDNPNQDTEVTLEKTMWKNHSGKDAWMIGATKYRATNGYRRKATLSNLYVKQIDANNFLKTNTLTDSNKTKSKSASEYADDWQQQADKLVLLHPRWKKKGIAAEIHKLEKEKNSQFPYTAETISRHFISSKSKAKKR